MILQALLSKQLPTSTNDVGRNATIGARDANQCAKFLTEGK